MKIKIGCTGWSYEGWSGTFYPKTIPNSNYLKYYSSIFEITEVNSTYYRIPTKQMTKKWYYDTPQKFQFSAKFPGKITHEYKLKNVKPLIMEFLSALDPLKQKIFALVFQLPPSLTFEDAKPQIDTIYEYLPSFYQYPIEGRHSSWFTHDAINFLREKNICLVWNEISGINNPAPITTDFIYLRLIGDRSIPEKKFGKIIKPKNNLIQKWAEKIKSVENKINSATIMVNNHFEGFAPGTANSFGLLFGSSDLIWEEKKQKSLTDF